MVNLHQLKHGVQEFLDMEVLPHMTGVKRYGATVYLALAMDGAEEKLHELLHNPLIDMLGIVNENDEIDLDRLHQTMVNSMDGDHLVMDIPLLGTFKFNRLDIDRLHDAIQRQPKG